MNRALKIILPLLLTVVILVSVGWYFIKYDPAFTQELLLNQARLAEDRGNLSLSTWLYNLSYRHSGNDETIAIELAAQYRSTGNFTKAEYTLSNAIADGGSIDLYIALCQTYVEQDKLLDAVTMLDNIADENIKQQLDAMRPAAPEASPEPGYHSDYISVAVTAQNGTIYYSTDKSYPSTENKPYSQPIELSAGDTTVYAVALGENGLVSPLKICSYTIAGVIEPVELTDSAIDQAVRQMLQVGPDYVLYSNDLWEITSLNIPIETKSLDDLKWMPYLKQLVLRGTAVKDLSPISNLTELEELIVSRQRVSEDALSIIAALPKLNVLTLNQCSLSGISPLSSATGITRIDLSGNTISDLSALSHMQELSYVDISNNAVDSLRVFHRKEKLTELYASDNMISSLDSLSNCPALTILEINNNALTSLTGIETLTELRNLHAKSNQLTDISPVASCVKLGDLNIARNAVTDISVLGALPELRMLDCSYNQIYQLPSFKADAPLVSINGSNNQISSLASLKGLLQLNIVNMEHNAGITSVAPLASCPAMVEVNVYYTGVTDASILTDNNSSIIVKYSPIGM